MLLSGYKKDIVRPECNPGFESVHCKACLNEDIAEVIPYINAVLGGTQYFNNPPEVMFHHHGRIIKVGSREIAINALKDEQEADRILEWLRSEINQAWENRADITPCFTGQTKPKLLEILKLLPRTNCKKCGRPTCMVFAAQLTEGAVGIDRCPELTPDQHEQLSAYLAGFDFE